MPLLFQRRFGVEHRAIPAATIRDWISRRPRRQRHHRRRRPAAAVHPARLPPVVHHRRRPARHATAHRPTRRRPPRHQHHHGLQGRLPRRSHQRPPRVHRPPPGATPRRRIPHPHRQEWQEFLGHFERRKVALGTCGRSYATPCIHEHSCLRCPLLRPDPAQRPRLIEIRDNLIARIAEARREGWLGELDGLQISLAGARSKLAQLDQITIPSSTKPGSRYPHPPALLKINKSSENKGTWGHHSLTAWCDNTVRHEALQIRVEVRGLRLPVVAAAGCSWGQPDPGGAGKGGKQPRRSQDGPELPDGPGLVSETRRRTRETSAITLLKRRHHLKPGG